MYFTNKISPTLAKHIFKYDHSTWKGINSIAVSLFKNVHLTIHSLTFSRSSSFPASFTQTSMISELLLDLERMPFIMPKPWSLSPTQMATKPSTRSSQTLFDFYFSKRNTNVPPCWLAGSSHTGLIPSLNK